MNFEDFKKEFDEKFPPLSEEEQKRLNDEWSQNYKERQESLAKMAPLERFVEIFSCEGHYPDCICMCGPCGKCDCSFEEDVAAIKNILPQLNIAINALKHIAESNYWWHENGEIKQFFTPDAYYSQKALASLA